MCAQILLDRIGGEAHLHALGAEVDRRFDHLVRNVDVQAVVDCVLAADVQPAQHVPIQKHQGVADQLILAVQQQRLGTCSHPR